MKNAGVQQIQTSANPLIVVLINFIPARLFTFKAAQYRYTGAAQYIGSLLSLPCHPPAQFTYCRELLEVPITCSWFT